MEKRLSLGFILEIELSIESFFVNEVESESVKLLFENEVEPGPSVSIYSTTINYHLSKTTQGIRLLAAMRYNI